MEDNANFAEYITAERERLTQERAQVIAEKTQLDHALKTIDSEFEAISAYEAAKNGKSVTKRSSNARRPQQARRGSKRTTLIELISSTGRLTRGEILERLGVKGDKSEEMSVSNALTALTKNNQLYRDGRHYYATSAAESAAAE